MTRDTGDYFVQALRREPFDSDLRRIYADWLEENDRLKKSAEERTLADDLDRCLTKAQVEKLKADLLKANGRRRERTLTSGDCFDCVHNALAEPDGWYVVTGIRVGKQYGRAAERTACIAARRSDGTLRVIVGIAPANHNSSATYRLCDLTARATPEQFRAWADAERSQ